MRILTAAALVIVVTGGAGCTLKNAAIPGAPITFANADFTVMGRTNAEECSTYAFGINFSHLFSDSHANVGGSVGGGLLGSLLGGTNAQESRAIFAALEKMPEASHLISPRIVSTESGLAPFGIMIFGSKCATVDARGVIIGTKPMPAPTYYFNTGSPSDQKTPAADTQTPALPPPPPPPPSNP